jgi:hypothetical protein
MFYFELDATFRPAKPSKKKRVHRCPAVSTPIG